MGKPWLPLSYATELDFPIGPKKKPVVIGFEGGEIGHALLINDYVTCVYKGLLPWYRCF